MGIKLRINKKENNTMQKIKILAISMSLVTLVGMTSGLTGCGETETETSEVLELSDDETMVVEAL